MIYLNINLDYPLLILFLTNVFLGKVLALYGYRKFSYILKVRMKNITTKINRLNAVLLLCVSIF